MASLTRRTVFASSGPACAHASPSFSYAAQILGYRLAILAAPDGSFGVMAPSFSKVGDQLDTITLLTASAPTHDLWLNLPDDKTCVMSSITGRGFRAAANSFASRSRKPAPTTSMSLGAR